METCYFVIAVCFQNGCLDKLPLYVYLQPTMRTITSSLCYCSHSKHDPDFSISSCSKLDVLPSVCVQRHHICFTWLPTANSQPQNYLDQTARVHHLRVISTTCIYHCLTSQKNRASILLVSSQTH